MTLFFRFFSFTLLNQDGWTALHWASSNGFTKILKLLLQKGANPNLLDQVRNFLYSFYFLSFLSSLSPPIQYQQLCSVCKLVLVLCSYVVSLSSLHFAIIYFFLLFYIHDIQNGETPLDCANDLECRKILLLKGGKTGSEVQNSTAGKGEETSSAKSTTSDAAAAVSNDAASAGAGATAASASANTSGEVINQKEISRPPTPPPPSPPATTTATATTTSETKSTPARPLAVPVPIPVRVPPLAGSVPVQETEVRIDCVILFIFIV